MSIDLEFPIYYFGRVKVKISVGQIGANLSNKKRYCLVLPFVCHTNNQKIFIELQQLLAQVDVVFLGKIIANDIPKLKKDYQSIYFSVSNMVDIGTMAIHGCIFRKKQVTTTMQALVVNLGYTFYEALWNQASNYMLKYYYPPGTFCRLYFQKTDVYGQYIAEKNILLL